MAIQQYDRFKDAPWFTEENSESVLIGGQGGIGSWLTFFLARAGFNITAYDDDLVESHNLGGQMFREGDIGSYKTVAVDSIIKEFTDTNVNYFNIKIDENSPTHYFALAAFDNMKARKDLFNVWKKSFETSRVMPLFIDGRLEAEQLQIFCVTPNTADKYEKEYLFADSEVEDTPCTFKQTSHSAAMIATHMVGFFTNHIANINLRDEVRVLPFYYEYFIPANLTESYE